MFSQIRHAVESLAQSPPPNSRPASEPSEDRELASRSRSLDLSASRSNSPLSSSQLAESALANLRKSLATQRSAGASSRNGLHSPPLSENRPMKSNLEERLRRATLAIGDTSVSNLSTTSTSDSPAPTPTTGNIEKTNVELPKSPLSVPLPDSPHIAPISETTVEAAVSNVPNDLELSSPSPLQPSAAIAPETPSVQELPTDASSLPSSQPISSVPAEPSPSPSILSPGDSKSFSSIREVQDAEPNISLGEGNTSDTQKAEEQRPEEVSSDGSGEAEEQHPGEDKTDESIVSNLQERLKQVEQRFTDVSTSFKRLQAEKLAADAVLRDLTPLESFQDSSALRSFLQSMLSETEMFQDEIKRLNGKLNRQESRIEELRDTHKLESQSQSNQIDKLRTQLQETEAIFQATQASIADAEKISAKQRADVEQSVAEIERLKTTAKQEEEKRVKAVSLLKTVRQKLVKAEKDKEDAIKELNTWKEKGKDEKEKENMENKKLQRELEALKEEKEKSETLLKAGFEKELTTLRDRYEKELSALKGQFELEAATAENLHSRVISNKDSQISTLEASLKDVTRDKNSFFDQLQLCQGELESAQAQVGSLSHQNNELKFQLRETSDRLVMAKEDLSDIHREQRSKSLQPVESPVDVGGLIAATEAKYESKITELKRNLTLLEKERSEVEAEWSIKVNEKGREIEELKGIIGSSSKHRVEEQETTTRLKAQVERAEERVKVLEEQVSQLPRLHSQLEELERDAKLQEAELATKITTLEQQIQDYKARELQLKQHNKQIREELRKVQSSAALLEKQRNPGVGYWTSRSVDVNASNPKLATSETSSQSSSRPASPSLPVTSPKEEEEVNLEYLRNVILQFLEHKEMRPNLVRVLSIILRFTPQETRRLIAKV